MSESIFARFDQVRIINLVDRPDRRREMNEQIVAAGGFAPNIAFFDARRPTEQGKFPTLGARGCFESQLAVLRAARDSSAASLCLLEDDVDFTRSGLSRATAIIDELFSRDWDIFHGAHILPVAGRSGLAEIAPDQPVVTASFVGFHGRVLGHLVEFLEAMLERPAGSPDYGPMHVDGAYTVFRMLNPQYRAFAAFPSLGRQRSSLSDITPTPTMFDRHPGARPFARLLRRSYNWLKRL
jgi:hypothetical protein